MIVNKTFVKTFITAQAEYKEGHCAEDGYMGFGMLYYAIVYSLKAKLCVCLGSGGGYVPRIMRQAQKDLALSASQTILVDNLSGNWGKASWTQEGSLLQTMWPEITIWAISTDEAFYQLKEFNSCINYVHIDADHGPQVVDDYMHFRDLLEPRGIMTLHDTKTACAVPELVRSIRNDPDWELINFPDYGAGVAIVRRVFDA